MVICQARSGLCESWHESRRLRCRCTRNVWYPLIQRKSSYPRWTREANHCRARHARRRLAPCRRPIHIVHPRQTLRATHRSSGDEQLANSIRRAVAFRLHQRVISRFRHGPQRSDEPPSRILPSTPPWREPRHEERGPRNNLVLAQRLDDNSGGAGRAIDDMAVEYDANANDDIRERCRVDPAQQPT